VKSARKLSTAGSATLLWNAWPDAHKSSRSEAFGRVYTAAVFGKVSQANRGSEPVLVLSRGGYHVAPHIFFSEENTRKAS
jgi:hypothetical protein